MTAPAWDCYSPVALVLWAAADFAQLGARWPVSAAERLLGFPPSVCDDDDVWDVIYEALGPTSYSRASDAERAIGLRIAAEFGPAGRPK